MYCKFCGMQLLESSNFCQYCGNAVSNIPNQPSKTSSTNRKWLFLGIGITILLILVFIFSNYGNNSIVTRAEDIIENTLHKNISITRLYFHEEKQVCYVEFDTAASSDIAAVYLSTGKTTYHSDYEYYNKQATKLRQQDPIDQQALHDCNVKILDCGDLIAWKYTLHQDGATEENGWKQLR